MWLQMLSDIFDTEIVTVNVSEGAAYGAALLAGVGAGVFRNVKEAISQCIKIKFEIAPSVNIDVYSKTYERYRALYPLLKNEFGELVKIVPHM
jgi:xylulokinase